MKLYSILFIMQFVLYGNTLAQDDNRSGLWRLDLKEGRLYIDNAYELSLFLAKQPSDFAHLNFIRIVSDTSVMRNWETIRAVLSQAKSVKQYEIYLDYNSRKTIRIDSLNRATFNTMLSLDLDSLEVLKISDFLLKDINFDSIRKYSTLKIFAFNENEINDITQVLSEIYKMPNLEILNLYRNPIKTLEVDYALYGKLRSLSLQYTAVKKIPCGLFYNTDIDNFFVQGSKIKIPKCIFDVERCIWFFGDTLLMDRNRETYKKSREKCERMNYNKTKK